MDRNKGILLDKSRIPSAASSSKNMTMDSRLAEYQLHHQRQQQQQQQQQHSPSGGSTSSPAKESYKLSDRQENAKSIPHKSMDT